jgi:putative transposase
MCIKRLKGTRMAHKVAGVDVAAIKRLRELEQENNRLKRILAERDLELDVTKEVLAKK